MTMLTLLEAAEQVGKSKSTLWGASKRGELSVTKDEAGQILVDSSELFRVFQAKIEALHAMVQELQRARDTWQAQAERLTLAAPIAAPGPTTPFTAEGVSAPTPAPEPEPRRSWLRWWFGFRATG